MAHFLLEIGVEEFPPSFIQPAAEHIRNEFKKYMEAERIPAQNYTIYYTCSRITLLADSIPEIQPDLREKITGAPKKIAVAEDGALTKAGEAFCKKNNITDYFFEEGKKGVVIAGWKEEKGNELEILFKNAFDKIIPSIPFKKSMRWSDKKLIFARPVRWFLMMINDEPIDHQLDGIQFSKTSFGHRFMAPHAVSVKHNNYEEELQKARVIVDPLKRKETIKTSVLSYAKKENASEEIDHSLLNEVTNIVEYPHPIMGKIPDKYMDLPPELITLVLKNDQRYFTIYTRDGKQLKPEFISILNNIPTHDETVIKGNEKVVAARLADAAFYFGDDKNKDFSGITEKLSDMLFQKDLGSYKDKVDRIQKLALHIAENYFDLSEAQTSHLSTAARLIKNDLLTGVVLEFPDLQGIMGTYYASYAGFDHEICAAIKEHYLPVFAGDTLPETTTGIILSLADKLDTIVGGFMAGMKPTGTKDKFAIRRNAISFLTLASSLEEQINIKDLITFSTNLITEQNNSLEKKTDEILDFFKQRYYAVLNFDTPVVQAAVESGFLLPVDVRKKTITIFELLKEKDIQQLAQLFKRSKNILKKAGTVTGNIDTNLFTEDEETKLWRVIEETEESIINIKDNLESAKEIVKIKPFLDNFFDNVMVMAEDKKTKINRILLLQRIVKLTISNIGDISFLNI